MIFRKFSFITRGRDRQYVLKNEKKKENKMKEKCKKKKMSIRMPFSEESHLHTVQLILRY